MLKRIIKNKNGDTLAETLVSVLIVSLASALLASMIGAASRMNLKAKEYDGQLDDAVRDMAIPSPTASTQVEMTLTSPAGSPITWSDGVKVSTSDETLVLSSYTYTVPSPNPT